MPQMPQMPTIETRYEHKRGCGRRKPGGIYLVGNAPGFNCCKLPIELTSCPCCGQGIKQSRGFTWIDAKIFSAGECRDLSIDAVLSRISSLLPATCPVPRLTGKLGLLWIGEKYYNRPSDFTREALAIGISKRIAQVPRDLDLNKTWICLAHPKAVARIEDLDTCNSALHFFPGIITIFQPTAIEYVVKGNETPQDLERLEGRGFTLVNVKPLYEPIQMFPSADTGQPGGTVV